MNNFTFGDIVIVEKNLIGVIVKCWQASYDRKKPPTYEVYVRSYNKIKEYQAHEMRRYLVRHKELSQEEIFYQDCSEGKEPDFFFSLKDPSSQFFKEIKFNFPCKIANLHEYMETDEVE